MDPAKPGRLKQHRGAAHGAGGFGILPFVAEDKGTTQIEVPFESRFGQQTRFGLAAWAMIGFVVRTNEDIIQGERGAQQIVHAIQFAARLVAPRNPRLVGRGEKHQAGGTEPFERLGSVAFYAQGVQSQRTDRSISLKTHLIQNAVALYKNCLLHGNERAGSGPKERLQDHGPRDHRIHKPLTTDHSPSKASGLSFWSRRPWSAR